MSDDERQILSLFNRYFFHYDRAEREGLLTCFTPDASCSFDVGGPPVEISGADAIVDSMVEAVGRRTGSNHMPSNYRIEVKGDRAASDMLALANIVYGIGSERRVLVRGLRYLDELVRTADGWRLSRRRHICQWQFEAPAVPAVMPGG